MNTAIMLLLSALIVMLSAFFVAVEFSLIAAKRHRIEEAAATSVSARAALRSSSDITMLLAGSQLGITLCTLALGALAEPAVHDLIHPVLETAGVPETVSGVAAMLLSLFIVTFVHLVVGEMMPKSWAIANPERSAIMLALPMRGFMAVTRPALVLLNGFANWLLHRVGVEPADEVASTQDPEGLEQLVEHSADTGVLDEVHSSHLRGALALRELRLENFIRKTSKITEVPLDATVGDVWAIAQNNGHLRVLVGTRGEYVGAVHVRDTIARGPQEPIRDLIYEVATFDADTLVSDAMTQMREARQHLAVITKDGVFRGVVSLSDILGVLFPQQDEAAR